MDAFSRHHPPFSHLLCTYHSSILQSLKPFAKGLLAIFRLVICNQNAVLLLLFLLSSFSIYLHAPDTTTLPLLYFPVTYSVILICGHCNKLRLSEEKCFKVFALSWAPSCSSSFAAAEDDVKPWLIPVHRIENDMAIIVKLIVGELQFVE